MPFYSYSCENCKKTFKSFHSPDECETKCIVCQSTSIKKNIPSVRTIETKTKQQTAGERVEKFIEESREVLKQQLEDSRKEYK